MFFKNDTQMWKLHRKLTFFDWLLFIPGPRPLTLHSRGSQFFLVCLSIGKFSILAYSTLPEVSFRFCADNLLVLQSRVLNLCAFSLYLQASFYVFQKHKNSSTRIAGPIIHWKGICNFKIPDNALRNNKMQNALLHKYVHCKHLFIQKLFTQFNNCYLKAN